MQSCASCAGYGTGSTIITAVPALLLLSTSASDPHGKNLPWWVIALWTLVLGTLGVAFGIPMKRAMINRDRLRFPDGTAAAVTLQSLFSEGREALLKARALYAAAAVGAMAPLLTALEVVRPGPGKAREPLLPDSSAIFDWLPGIRGAGKTYAPSEWTMRLDHSFLVVGAGVIVGLRVSASMVLGGLALVLFLGPRGMESMWNNPAGDLVAAVTKPGAAWKQIGIWYGAPLMVSYGLLTVALQGKVVGRALRGIVGNVDGADDALTRGVEVPFAWFVWGAGASAMGVVALSWGYFGIPPLLALLAVVLSFFLTLVAARATGETSVTPVGPMGKITQLTYGVLLPQNAVANLVTAGITANAAGSCADLLNDLKVGYLLGANPRRQLVAQLFGVVVGTVATTVGYLVLIPDATAITGIDGAPPRFAAPGALQWKAVADVFRVGIDNLHPLARQGIAVGLALGAALAVAEAALPKHKRWIPSATGLGFGFMLPFSTPLSFLVGALVAEGVTQKNRTLAERYLVPVASGAIAGESILGVVVAAVNNLLL
jgi:uncharacterized oligopeptide transporter (OPT) family protein